MNATSIYAAVNDRYSASARTAPSSQYSKSAAEAFGYTPEELATIPTESNLGLSCGNPLALASLREGETVVDLGSGAGFDCFLAARKVGATGRVVGIDMNEDMLAKARTNASKANITNTTFISARITNIPLPSSSADVIISNCVINLVPASEKSSVFHEMFRLLKPGGRVAISDILAKKSFSEEMRKDVALYVGCVAGASMKEEYENWLEEAGFQDALVVDAGSDLNVYTRDVNEGGVASGCCSANAKDTNYTSSSKKEDNTRLFCCGGKPKESGGVIEDMRTNFSEVDLNEWAGSFKIFAVKPAEAS